MHSLSLLSDGSNMYLLWPTSEASRVEIQAFHEHVG